MGKGGDRACQPLEWVCEPVWHDKVCRTSYLKSESQLYQGPWMSCELVRIIIPDLARSSEQCITLRTQNTDSILSLNTDLGAESCLNVF